jgi:hypothetical protein
MAYLLKVYVYQLPLDTKGRECEEMTCKGNVYAIKHKNQLDQAAMLQDINVVKYVSDS